MRGDTHVRFGGRARETDPGQPGHRARARPHRSDKAAIMPDRRSPLVSSVCHVLEPHRGGLVLARLPAAAGRVLHGLMFSS
jgi:hypothetical protein